MFICGVIQAWMLTYPVFLEETYYAHFGGHNFILEYYYNRFTLFNAKKKQFLSAALYFHFARNTQFELLFL